MSAYGGPVDPNVALGDFGKCCVMCKWLDILTTMYSRHDMYVQLGILATIYRWCVVCLNYGSFCVVTETVNGTAQYTLAKAIIVTFIINNHVKSEDNKRAEAWEKE